MANYAVEEDGSYAQQFDYDVSGNVIYSGFAAPGSLTSSAVWAVRSYTYSGNNLVAIKWAGGGNAMAYVWDNRASLSYS